MSMNWVTNTNSHIEGLPGNPMLIREMPPDPKITPCMKAGISKVNDFRYKSTLIMSDLSGEKMFVKKDPYLFGSPQSPQLYLRDKLHARSKNLSREALFAINMQLGSRIMKQREGLKDGMTVETSLERGKKHTVP